MRKLLCLCLWQTVILGIISVTFPLNAEEQGVRMRGPKGSDTVSSERYGPIVSSDTLWTIASKVRPDPRLSLYQVMEALYQQNPQAFADKNINHLVNGMYLVIPSYEEMLAVNPETARQKSERDAKTWKQVKPQKSTSSNVAKTNKVDLKSATSEVNKKFKKVVKKQQADKKTAGDDMSDSMIRLQAVLQENDELRQRLASFSDKLTRMEEEVAKNKEIKLQMDDMISLQKALLVKAEAREKQLLKEKKQVVIVEESFTASLWFKVVMGTTPALLILLYLFLKSRQYRSREVSVNDLDNKSDRSASSTSGLVASELPQSDNRTSSEKLSLNDELDLDDELGLDDEFNLALDDELELDDEIGLDDELGLSDGIIHLDEDDDSLDEFNDEEEILADSAVNKNLSGKHEMIEDDLNSLLADFENEPSENQSIANESTANTIDESGSHNVEKGQSKPDDFSNNPEIIKDELVSSNKVNDETLSEPLNSGTDNLDQVDAEIVTNVARDTDDTLLDLASSIESSAERQNGVDGDVTAPRTVESTPSDLKGSGLNDSKQIPSEQITLDKGATLAKSADASNENVENESAQSLQNGYLNEQEQARKALGDELLTSVDNQTNGPYLPENTVSPSSTAQQKVSLNAEHSAEYNLAEENTDDLKNEKALTELREDNRDLINDDALESIGELDNVDFDELLADIEQESVNHEQDKTANHEQFDDIGDALISQEQHQNTSGTANANEKDYVSVDELLNASFVDNNTTEPYEKHNIEVGLEQFSDNTVAVDVDTNGSVSAKLDLAKMYLEMNDQENAEVILHEVVLKGDSAQKVEAQSLLNKLKP